MNNSSVRSLVLSGRIILATMFVVSGLAKLASTHVQTTGYVVSDGFPLSTEPALLLGAFEILSGIWLGLGYKLRFVAPALAAFVLVTNFVFHSFWAFAPEYQFAQQLLFMKNLSVIGGLLLVAAIAGRGRQCEVPLDWEEQRSMCGFASTGG